MPLKLTPAKEDWNQPPSAEQSPVDQTAFRDVYQLSVAFSVQMEAFITAAAAFDTSTSSPSTDFIKQWKLQFEKCLAQFKEVDEGQEGSDASGGVE
ncbi:hypothetical protein HBH98_172400 [Parastagonospora nodorum]|nr:hypothetical protein HBH53_245100 [Parastagonospora nodorum]KAH3961719.1 hypothetical protein HBH51_180340 [Parastagonospora nodorum]KAH4012819.1 hypothetical protein HBI09_221190 [Parastagonospora nodorum]KAH4163688.1 hypothetical protein HBH43_153840 [Parastagonospora nodorum]KAH4216375.1 hypothetical protein HBI06_231640 [Parastagonospora nodorum]